MLYDVVMGQVAARLHKRTHAVSVCGHIPLPPRFAGMGAASPYVHSPA